MDEDMYRQYILSVFNDMHHKREIADATYGKEGFNASCGDRVHIYMQVQKDGIIDDMSFTGEGCLLSQVSAELLSKEMKGKNIKDLQMMDVDDVINIIGMQPTPSRMKCIELPLSTAKDMIR